MKTVMLMPILFICLSACNNPDSEFSNKSPENLDDGLNTGTLESANISSDIIEEAVDQIRGGKFKEIHSFLIYRDNKLVLEEYFRGHRYDYQAPGYFGEVIDWDRTVLHPIMSCTKSITSACIDIAIEKGFIESVHQSIFDYLPDHQQFKTAEKKQITIEHLLTMTSGLQWDEWHAPHATAANDIDRLYIECWEDPLACVLERPLVSEPGQSFTYNGGGFITLGEILRHATNMGIVQFAKHYLFEPLGIDTLRWDKFPNGEVEAGGGLSLKPRDMLKFGITYLNDGVWNGKTIVSSDWVKKSSGIYGNNKNINAPIEDSGKNGYGYTWWITEPGNGRYKTKMFRANGWGGQVIMVFPELDMVVVFTGGNYTTRSKLFKIVERYILPATIY
jgi:CubicO group peptidase (beta-lactamase class C family)